MPGRRWIVAVRYGVSPSTAMPASPDLEARRTRLPGGPLEYSLRRSTRSRSLRVTIDPRAGVVVSVPLASRRGWARPEPAVERFLAEREPWLRRHLERMDRQRRAIEARGGVSDGAEFRYLGELHRLRIMPAPAGVRRSSVVRLGADDGDELHLLLAPRDYLASRDRARPTAVLRDWLRDRAVAAVDRAVALHAPPLGVTPARITFRDPRSRWGSASRTGSISLSWRLILTPPEALETVVIHELAHLRVFGHGPGFWALVAARRPDHERWRRWLRTHSQEVHAALDGTGER
ncbi:MAG: M48 family metallopeptidase [Chloroflexi bacterium]|nr:M48 family metallopeptidase [Chloroflexota bacterium]